MHHLSWGWMSMRVEPLTSWKIVSPCPVLCSGCCCCWARRCFCLADCRHIVIISVQASIFERVEKHLDWADNSNCWLMKGWSGVTAEVWRRGRLQVWEMSSVSEQAGTQRCAASPSCWSRCDWLVYLRSGLNASQPLNLLFCYFPFVHELQWSFI